METSTMIVLVLLAVISIVIILSDVYYMFNFPLYWSNFRLYSIEQRK